MSIDRQGALRALDEIETAKSKASSLRGYAIAAPHLITWGVIWCIGGAATYFAREASDMVWATLIWIGVIAATYFGMRARAEAAGAGAELAKTLLTMLAGGLTFGAVTLVVGVDSYRDGLAFVLLVVAGAYAILGVWRGARILIMGAVLGAGVLFGWYLLGEHFEVVACSVGGLLLIASGLWLRGA